MSIFTVSEDKAISMIREKMATNNSWLLRGLKAIYENQNASEKISNSTIYKNGIGFNMFDSSFLTSCAKQYIEKNNLTPNQIAAVRKRMGKYAKQLYKIAIAKNSIENENKPQWQHDCDKCKFIGKIENYDCYTCDDNSLIARYGDEGQEYKAIEKNIFRIFANDPSHQNQPYHKIWRENL